jgi:hypothetical protein
VSSEGFLLRFFLGLGASLCAVLLAVGCAVEQRAAGSGAVLGAGQTGGSWATQAELAWLAKLGAWDARLMQGLREAARIETTPHLARGLAQHDGETLERHEQALEPTVTCTSDLQRRVGPAPTERLQKAHAAFRRACTHLERFQNAVALAIYQGRDYEVRQAQLEARRGSALLLQADQMVPPGEIRSLPVLGGDSAESRIEPRFGRLASALAGKEIEVRCWSAPDWRRLMREEQTYTRGQLGPDTLGFAGISGDRVNLAPDVCEPLVDLAYNGARPADEAGQLRLAAAVVTLSHEPQHSKGVSVEAVAECNAIQLAHRTAVKLGASRAYAAALVRTYWRHYDEELAAYRSSECRKGGTLDRGYAGSTWP